jgi:SAM-dependent methyltransferase
MMPTFTDKRKSLMGTNAGPGEIWSSGELYERYVGRWSRLVALEFVSWLEMPEHGRWLDVGCGTGALSQTVLKTADPQYVLGIDRSEEYVNTARSRVDHPTAEFRAGDAQSLPVESDAFDVAVSGLVLNFVPSPGQMIGEMKRAVRTGGTVAVYVWDYGGMMQFLRHFWNAVAALDPSARDLDEGRRFPICNPDALLSLFYENGLRDLEINPIDISTNFKDFDDYWAPFLGGQGPAPGYAMSLSGEMRARLRDRIYNSLPFALDGSIPLVARSWAIKGVK